MLNKKIERKKGGICGNNRNVMQSKNEAYKEKERKNKIVETK